MLVLPTPPLPLVTATEYAMKTLYLLFGYALVNMLTLQNNNLPSIAPMLAYLQILLSLPSHVIQ